MLKLHPIKLKREVRMAAVVLHVEITLKAGTRERFLARAQEHRKNVLEREPQCQRFDISSEEGNPETIRLYEVYDNEAAVEQHMGTGYMASYREDTGPFVEDRKITRAVLQNG
jgi:autoinducer 2-degrading protein